MAQLGFNDVIWLLHTSQSSGLGQLMKLISDNTNIWPRVERPSKVEKEKKVEDSGNRKHFDYDKNEHDCPVSFNMTRARFSKQEKLSVDDWSQLTLSQFTEASLPSAQLPDLSEGLT